MYTYELHVISKTNTTIDTEPQTHKSDNRKKTITFLGICKFWRGFFKPPRVFF